MAYRNCERRSGQRILVERRAYNSYLRHLVDEVGAVTTGDPARGDTMMGPLITDHEAARVHATIRDAVSQGAKVLVGGGVDGAVHDATVVADVPTNATLLTDELFGSGRGGDGRRRSRGCRRAVQPHRVRPRRQRVHPGPLLDDAVLREVDAGVVHINWSPLWRVDPMPYGGLKGSGIGKEGPKYAIEEMTDVKTIVFHP